ncbi:efflux RND transporter periplasmic adaptor subunit [soil metagenome]
MKYQKTLLTVVVISVLGVSGYGMYSLGMQRSGAKPDTVSGDTSTAAADKKVLYWHDPMVPAQKFDKPGKSPFMDMQLVPVYAGDASDEGRASVNISPRLQQNLGIRTAEVTKGKLPSALTAVGNVSYNERDVNLIQARSNGFVEKLYVRATLDPVKKGQVLAELYVPDWIAAQEEYLTVKRMQGSGADALLHSLLDGARQRMRLVGMSDAQIRQIESSGKVHTRIAVTAPDNGVIAELIAREGMTVMTGAPLFRINGLSTVWVNAEIPESAVAQIHAGNPVDARTPSLPGSVFTGKVSTILPEVNASTRTLKARIELTNRAAQLVPGMFITVHFGSANNKEVLLIPSEAVIQTGTRTVVMVALGEGKFMPIDVDIGAEANGLTEIRKGLEVGQKIVISGQFLIDSEASLKGTISRMNDMPASDASMPVVSTHRGQGKVEKIDKNEITLSHGPIASLQWGAMTMGFTLPSAGLPRNVALGDAVTFEIRAVKDGQFQIVSISPVATTPSQMTESMKSEARGGKP